MAVKESLCWKKGSITKIHDLYRTEIGGTLVIQNKETSTKIRRNIT